MTSYGGEVADAGFTSGRRECHLQSPLAGWLTCTDTDPLTGLAASQKRLVRFETYLIQDHPYNYHFQLPDIPAPYVTQMQCIESCRFFSFDYAVANKVDGVCSCSRQSAATVSGPLPHQCTDAMKHEIYSVVAITESPTCDHLYFRKHVYAPGDYKVETQI